MPLTAAEEAVVQHPSGARLPTPEGPAETAERTAAAGAAEVRPPRI